MIMKRGSAFVAVASGPIQGRKRALLVGIVAREDRIEGVLSSRVAVNGDDATKRIISMVSRTRFGEQVRIAALTGIAIAGLNVVDVPALERGLDAETIVFTRARPDPRKLVHALQAFGKKSGADVKARVALVREQAKRKTACIGGFHLQSRLEKRELSSFARHTYEMLRMAHLVASGVGTGESKGRI